MQFQTVYQWTTDDDKSFPNVSVELEVSYRVKREERDRYSVQDVRIEGIGDILVWLNGHGFKVDSEADATFRQWLEGQFNRGESKGDGLYEAIVSHCEADYLDQLSYAE